jgi:hypothetical protein
LSSLMEERYIHMPLRTRCRKMAVILVVGIPALALAILSTRIALAARFGSHFNAPDLRRAIALDPGNAAYDYELGLVCAYSLGQANLAGAVHFLRKATELNPRKALYWSDLAEVCDTLNHTACSEQAVEKALALSPTTPRFEWKAANHYLQTGQTEEALKHFRRLLRLDGTYAQPVFQVCLRVLGNPQSVSQKVLPPGNQPQLKLAYLDFVSAQGDIDFANRIWSQISSEGLSYKFSDVKPYLEHLLAGYKIQQATKVWQELEQAGVIPETAVGRSKNLVYNAEFGHKPLNAGFDWRIPITPYIETDFQDPSAYRGSHCLRVDYAAGRNLESEPVYQLVPVVPGHAYELRAHVRSDDITSDSGPRLRVLDPACPACLNVSTRTTVGTMPWHLLTLNFTAGADTRVVRLSIWRSRSWTFPMEISGSFWLDDVSITALNPLSKATASSH